jgi:DNA-binding NtrC family response regulator
MVPANYIIKKTLISQNADWDERTRPMVEEIDRRTSELLKGDNDSTPEARQKVQNLRMALEEFEKQLIIDALEQNQGHRGKTAEILGIDRKTLYTKLKKYGVI